MRCSAITPATSESASVSGDDWYMNLLWLDRRKCLLLVHAETLFPVFTADVRAADVGPVGPLVVVSIAAELYAEGLPWDALGPLDGGTLRVAKTASRSVLGFMNKMALYLNFTQWPAASTAPTAERVAAAWRCPARAPVRARNGAAQSRSRWLASAGRRAHVAPPVVGASG